MQSGNNSGIILDNTYCTFFQEIEICVETTCSILLAENIYKLNEIYKKQKHASGNLAYSRYSPHKLFNHM